MTVEQYLRKLSGLDKEVLLVDHNYVKAWNAHPDSNRTKPARLLFMKGLQRYPLLSDTSNVDDDVDIEVYDEPLLSPFDNPKIKALANECEKSLKNNHLFKDREQDEEIDLSSLSPSQRKLYQQVLNVLHEDELSKLCYSGSANEPLRRRLSLDKAARQIRQIFGLIFWDTKEISWIHRTILNHCDISTVASYVDVLQTLKAKIPTLIERVLQSYAGAPVGDAIIQLMKKPWDPVQPVLNQNKPKKLPGNPIILICPSAPNQNAMNAHSPRLRFWHNSLSSMCKVMNIPVHSEDGKDSPTIEGCLDQMILIIRNKVTELKNHYPNRPLILLGWTIGALIACHIALQEPVDGVICIGFPLTGVNGSRGDLNDPLLDNKVPTLFLVGQNARMCSTDDVEDFRSRMRAETGLVIVGGCDDLLRMCPSKMKLENTTQAIVDRCLLDEISDFLMSVVIKLPSTSAANASAGAKVCTPIKEEPEVSEETWKPEEEGKRRRRKPREYSPELSPVRKRARHHIQRQSPSSAKARLSPSSSETSSSGSLVNETAAVSKPVKKLPEKRIGRPTAGTWRKRTPSKSESHSTEISSKKILRMEETASTPKTATPSEPKLPFSKNILPKKNDPVDVEKAFGKDSSFLPRPLTPPEPEDTVSAEETEKALAELEAMSKAASDSQLAKNANTTATSLLGDAISGDRAFLPISDLESEAKKLDSAPASRIETVPTTALSTENKTTVSVSLSPSLQSMLAQGKQLSPGSLQALKTAGGISLLANNSASSSSPKSTIITVPSASAATILVSSPALRSQPGKMIQLLAKTNSTLAVKSPVSSGKESSEQQSCNLSLLSDVAGMTEPMSNSARMADGASQPAATLVKLAASDTRGPFQTMKCLKVFKTVKPLSPPTRFETAEEQVEKQLAIQSLNKSIGIESQSNLVKESGYSICYAKADGSIVSRSVTRPNFTGYVTVPPTMQGQNRGRGRARSVFNKQIRFSNM
ncbi:KAT8 regulatory NSL complex subunit 3 [Araneus ventricosus]|uniref:KAT8 regulatory NSL complex subunit 3 n=1 Tax=Araneus ventricosus TaxID=182803 RepID=A0A4Y2DGR2_ARAVE|nr:KAT8 regulatory NSL complex subunit 3 [Araneus ventricosus]